MSPPTWTPVALRSEVAPYAGLAWRLVEAQHIVATQKLVDSLEEQAVLEDILEETKPPVPEACRDLDYLLSTPFSYRPYPHGSRFRRAGLTPGIWYGAERVEISLAEMVFYRFLFHAESPATPFPKDAAQYTAFAARVESATALDLTADPLASDAALWTDPLDYAPCQALEESARAAGAEVLRYRSVRDPRGGAALAILTCAAFAETAPNERHDWRVHLSRTGAMAVTGDGRTRL